MTHNEKRAHWVKEGLITGLSGVLYGVTLTVVSHPLDTIKTKMQAQTGFEKTRMISTFTRVVQTQGLRGLYKGCVPPLIGSGLFRSIGFSTFEASYTYMDNELGRTEIPLTGGVQVRVIASSLLSATIRCFIEGPLDYAKIKRQTNQTWKMRNIYTGLYITWLRSCVLNPAFYISFDFFRRNYDDLFRSKIAGPFLLTGISAVVALTVCWPLELMKVQIQSGYLEERRMSLYERLRYTIRERGGFLGLYRGITPGCIKGFYGNGCAMIVMQYAQRKLTELGFRE